MIIPYIMASMFLAFSGSGVGSTTFTNVNEDDSIIIASQRIDYLSGLSTNSSYYFNYNGSPQQINEDYLFGIDYDDAHNNKLYALPSAFGDTSYNLVVDVSYEIRYASNGSLYYYHPYIYTIDLGLPFGNGFYFDGFSSDYYLIINYSIRYIPEDLYNAYTTGYPTGYNDGYNSGYSSGYSSGQSNGYTSGYADGLQEGIDTDSTALTITTGIINVGLLPVNVFLKMFNYEIFGVNISSVVSAFLTIAIVLIVIRMITGKKSGSD